MFKELILKSKIKAKIKNLKKSVSSESGRSMVEMLGVLAIMGILSIGAIAGYRYAVDQYKANETINELTLRAVSVGEQVRQNRGTLTMDEFPATTRQGYPVTAFREPNDPKLFELEVTDVPVGVCQKILKMGWKLPVLIKANEIVYGGNDLICEPSEMDNRETATMVFLFDEDLDETALPNWYCEKDSDCGSCQRCQENICVSSCEGYERCAEDTETGEQICCPPDRRSGPYCCAKAVNGMCCNENDQCCPWHKPLIGKDGNCYACDNEGGVNVTGVEENCDICSNRELWERTTTETQCVIPCPEGIFLRDMTGKCHACDEADPIDVLYFPQTCQLFCENRILNGVNDRYCSLPCGEGTFTGTNGKCYDCGDERNISVQGVSHDGCERCNNRMLYETACILNCDDYSFRASDGNCYSCDYPNPVLMSSQSEYCSIACPNRVLNGTSDLYCSLPCTNGQFSGRYGECYSCDDPKNIDIHGVLDNSCEKCGNRIQYGSICIMDCPMGEFRGSDGECHLCLEENPVNLGSSLTSSYCVDKCPNRFLNGSQNRYCSLPCREGAFTGSNGKCYACNEEKNISIENVSHDGCERCPDTRNLYNGWCVPKCSGDSPLRGSDNKCYPCDTETRVPVSGMTDACYECADQRKLDGNYCILK